MLKLVERREYPKGVGFRLVYEAEKDLLLPREESEGVFVPRGKRVEVSVLEAAPDHGEPEAALIYQGAFLQVERGVKDPEALLARVKAAE